MVEEEEEEEEEVVVVGGNDGPHEALGWVIYWFLNIHFKPNLHKIGER